MPNSVGVPTLNDLLTQAGAINKENAEAKKQELVRKQQAHLVDPKTGKSMAGIFDPVSGSYEMSQNELGYGPRTDPESGYVVPSSVAVDRGMQGLGKSSQTPAQQSNSLGSMLSPQQTQPQPPSLNPKQRDAMDDSVKRLESDPVYKEAKASVMNSDRLIQTAKLATNNPVMLGQLGAQVAKDYEGGRLTDEDVVRYTKDPSIAGKIRDAISKAAQGTVSAETAKYIIMGLEAQKSSNQDKMNQLSGGEVQRVNSIRGVPTDVASKIITPSSYKKSLQPSNTPEAQANKQTLSQNIQPGTGDKAIQAISHPIDTLKSFLKPKHKETPEEELRRLKAKHGRK